MELFGIRLLQVGPDRFGVLKFVRAISDRGSLPPEVVKGELENGLPMLVRDDLHYFEAGKIKSKLEALGAEVEVFVSVSE